MKENKQEQTTSPAFNFSVVGALGVIIAGAIVSFMPPIPLWGGGELYIFGKNFQLLIRTIFYFGILITLQVGIFALYYKIISFFIMWFGKIHKLPHLIESKLKSVFH